MSKITITILGTTAGMPTIARAHSAIYVSYDDGEEHTLLFDCGEGTQRQLMFAHLRLMKINHVFITHWHGDHALGLPGLVDTMGFEGRTRPLAVYAPEAYRVKRSLGFCHSFGKFKIEVHNIPTKGERIANLLELDRFYVVSTPAHHSIPAASFALIEKDKHSIDLEKAKVLGLPEKSPLYSKLMLGEKVIVGSREVSFKDISILKKGKRIVYSGDTEICANLKSLAYEADLLIQDSTYFDNQYNTESYKHAVFSEIVEMAKEIKAKKVVLTHISRKHQGISAIKNMLKDYPNFVLAEDFMRVVV